MQKPTKQGSLNTMNGEIHININIDEIVYTLIEEIKKLPDGTETTTSEVLEKALPDLEISDNDMFEINERVFEKAEVENLILDGSKYNGACVGLPFHIPFIKYTKNN